MALVLMTGFGLMSCGGSRPTVQSGPGAGTSIAAAVVAFVAPRDGGDAVIGAQLGRFAETVQSKLIGDCMTNDGFAVPSLLGGGPPTDLGNPQFPNLPAIQASHDLGLFTGGVPLVDPESGMSAPERRAWQARISRCFRTTQGRDPLFGSAKFAQLSSGWYSVVNQVSQSKPIRTLSRTAATCSAAHGVAASSVMSLYQELQNRLGPLSSSSGDSAQVQALQAKGASVLVTCWSKVIDETTTLLSGRRATYLAEHASELSAIETQVNNQVSSLEHQYGIKLALVSE